MVKPSSAVSDSRFQLATKLGIKVVKGLKELFKNSPNDSGAVAQPTGGNAVGGGGTLFQYPRCTPTDLALLNPTLIDVNQCSRVTRYDVSSLWPPVLSVRIQLCTAPACQHVAEPLFMETVIPACYVLINNKPYDLLVVLNAIFSQCTTVQPTVVRAQALSTASVTNSSSDGRADNGHEVGNAAGPTTAVPAPTSTKTPKASAPSTALSALAAVMAAVAALANL